MKYGIILKYLRFIFPFCLTFGLHLFGHSQNIQNMDPEKVHLGGLDFSESNGDKYVNRSTGRASFTIPIHTLKSTSTSQAISLSYSSTGFNASEVYPSEGKGWKLNFGPAISREINYFADEQKKRKFSEVYDDTQTLMDLLFDGTTYHSDLSVDEDDNTILNHEFDMSDDIFHYNINGLSNSFVLDTLNTGRWYATKMKNDDAYIYIETTNDLRTIDVYTGSLKYSFSGKNQVWKQVREDRNTPEDWWEEKNVATGYTSYLPVSIDTWPTRSNGPIYFEYTELEPYDRKINGFTTVVKNRAKGNLNWNAWIADYGGTFFDDYYGICMEHCMGYISADDPNYSFVNSQCVTYCTGLAEVEDGDNNTFSDSKMVPNEELIREKKTFLSKAYSDDSFLVFHYDVLDSDNQNNVVLKQIDIYQPASPFRKVNESYEDKLLLWSYFFQYDNYGDTNLLKVIDKKSPTGTVLETVEMSYYYEELLDTSYDELINHYGNFSSIISDDHTENAKVGELKSVQFASLGSKIDYSYSDLTPDTRAGSYGVTVDNVDIISNEQTLSYGFSYGEYYSNTSLKNNEFVIAVAIEEDCDNMDLIWSSPGHFDFDDTGGNFISSDHYSLEKSNLEQNYFTSSTLTHPNGGKSTNTYSNFGNSVKLISSEIFDNQGALLSSNENLYTWIACSPRHFGQFSNSWRQLGSFEVYSTYSYGDQVTDHCYYFGTPMKYFENLSYDYRHRDEVLVLEAEIKTDYFPNGTSLETKTEYFYEPGRDDPLFNHPDSIVTTNSKGDVKTTEIEYHPSFIKPELEREYLNDILVQEKTYEYDVIGYLEESKVFQSQDLISDLQLISHKKFIRSLWKVSSVYDFITNRHEQIRYANLGLVPEKKIVWYNEEDNTVFEERYEYGPLGLKTKFFDNGLTERYTYDEAGRLIEVRDVQNNLLQSYEYGSANLPSVPRSALNDINYGGFTPPYYPRCEDSPEDINYAPGCTVGGSDPYNVTIILADQEYTFTCSSDEFIYDVALSNGVPLDVDSYCLGTCENNMGRIVTGDVDQSNQSFLSDCEIEKGYCMVEVAYPLCDVVIEMQNSN